MIAAYPATSILMGINLLVFAVMLRWSPIIPLWKAHQYGSILTAQFDGNVLYYFGGCDDWVAIGGGQWWRLITACFVHASILHIATNLWCLWNLGLFGEPLLGRWGLAWVYLLTGVTGNLLSAAESVFTRTDAIAVGASGAIFGIAGILIVLLSNRKLAIAVGGVEEPEAAGDSVCGDQPGAGDCAAVLAVADSGGLGAAACEPGQHSAYR